MTITPDEAEAMVARFRATVKHDGAEVGDLPWLEEFWAVRHEDAIAALARLREADRAEIERLQAELARRGQKVQVKPLEWKAHHDKYDGGRSHYGTGAFDHWYCASRCQDGVWLLMHHVGGRPLHFTPFPTLDAAKAAAQVDYEARIRAALVPPGDVAPLASEGADHG